MAKQDDGLFLLEVLIDKIVFVKSPCFSDKDFRTCVNVKCLSVEPLEICDDDPGACGARSGGPFIKIFNSGKSCLFSLKESEIKTAMSKFPIKISVYKSLPCGCLPTKIVMGEATIDMTKEFVQARKKFLEDPSNVSFQALKDSFRITGPDGVETGEVVMFLRISCFGKLIITKFQGASGPPNLGAGSAANTAIDRSCNPRKDFQTAQEPCACGAARGHGGAGGSGISGPPCTMGGGGGGGGGFGVCPPARDPYNSMPCQDPDDPCYCTGPKAPAKQQMVCRNTDQYCLHVPKGTLLNLPFSQELTEEQKMNIRASYKDMDQFRKDEYYASIMNRYSYAKLPIKNNIHECLEISVGHIKLPSKMYAPSEKYSATSLNTLGSKRRSVSFSDTISSISYQSLSNITKGESSNQGFYAGQEIFGKKETTVYMALYDEFCRFQHTVSQSTIGTQATATINKCLQVRCNNKPTDIAYATDNFGMNPLYYSTFNMSEQPNRENKSIEKVRYSDVYFWGRKKDESDPDRLGMGSSGSRSKRYKSDKPKPDQPKTTTTPKPDQTKTNQTNTQTETKPPKNNQTTNTKENPKGTSAGTSTKIVSIKEERPCPTEKPCPAISCVVKGDMGATVTHIRLGPREPCPTHGNEPCQGPKCILASSGQEKAPVKITTMTNPRRGVFELVIRKITGAPLAKNELMLEWTPPPSRPSCGTPCSVPCVPSPCRPSQCKMIVCRPSPCKPKGCRKPCGPLPCRSVPCKSSRPCKPCKPVCCRPCRTCPPPRKIFKRPTPRCKPCGSCKPCPPSPCSLCMACPPSPCKSCRRCRPGPPVPCRSCQRCKPCPPSPCVRCPPAICSPCPPSSCSTSCKSSPCLRPCPMRCKKTRKCKSQPKIRSHRKRISPCCNRSKACPVVRCRSVPGQCPACCGIPPCPPRKCCSISPCKPLKGCKSCSSCCG